MISAERRLLHAWAEHVPILKEAFPLFLCPGLLPVADILERTGSTHPGRQLFAGPCQQLGIPSLESHKDEPPSRACSQFSEEQAFCSCGTLRKQAGEFGLHVHAGSHEPCSEPQHHAPDQKYDPRSSGHGAPVVMTMTDRSPSGARTSMLLTCSRSPENRTDSTCSCTALSSGRRIRTHRRGSPCSVTL